MTKYLLPCPDGSTVEVDASQAGMTVRSATGAEVQVPTLRGLQQLQRVETPEEVKAPKRKWGLKQQLIFGGLVLILFSALGFYFMPPVGELIFNDLQFEDNFVGSLQSFEWMRQGLPPLDGPVIKAMNDRKALINVLRIFAGAVGVAGIGLVLYGAFLPQRQQRKPRAATGASAKK